MSNDQYTQFVENTMNDFNEAMAEHEWKEAETIAVDVKDFGYKDFGLYLEEDLAEEKLRQGIVSEPDDISHADGIEL